MKEGTGTIMITTLIQDYTNKEFQIILKDIVAKLALNSTLWIHISSNEMRVSTWYSFRQTNFKNGCKFRILVSLRVLCSKRHYI